MNWESIGTIDVMLRRPKVPEIVSWCVLISALDEAAITRIRVSLCKNTGCSKNEFKSFRHSEESVHFSSTELVTSKRG